MTTTKIAVASAPGDDRIRRSRLAWVADTLALSAYLPRKAVLGQVANLAARMSGGAR